jgi:hypothetical protein
MRPWPEICSVLCPLHARRRQDAALSAVNNIIRTGSEALFNVCGDAPRATVEHGRAGERTDLKMIDGVIRAPGSRLCLTNVTILLQGGVNVEALDCDESASRRIHEVHLKSSLVFALLGYQGSLEERILNGRKPK